MDDLHNQLQGQLTGRMSNPKGWQVSKGGTNSKGTGRRGGWFASPNSPSGWRFQNAAGETANAKRPTDRSRVIANPNRSSAWNERNMYGARRGRGAPAYQFPHGRKSKRPDAGAPGRPDPKPKPKKRREQRPPETEIRDGQYFQEYNEALTGHNNDLAPILAELAMLRDGSVYNTLRGELERESRFGAKDLNRSMAGAGLFFSGARDNAARDFASERSGVMDSLDKQYGDQRRLGLERDLSTRKQDFEITLANLLQAARYRKGMS